MAEQHVSGQEEYNKRQKWARDLAEDLGIGVDESAEHFVVPMYDESGKETGSVMISARETIPLADENGKIKATIDIKRVIDATKRFPRLPLSQALVALDKQK